MQLGFVIDHARCIGCHACTVACKAENDVPVGSFRTWVKYTEQGTFPAVKRSFAVLRCNQCTAAPCVTICPVGALGKRSDGIVDLDPEACIGCKSCLQACPYDALYINDATGTAEKCHFCAHRVETGLAPACAVVCPTEAIVPGDFDDPESRVSKLKTAGALQARKTEVGTQPNVFYREVAAAGIDPSLTNAAGGFLWANQLPSIQLDAEVFEALDAKAKARTTYDVSHAPMWGWMVSTYMLTKSVATGVFLAIAALLPPLELAGGAGPHLPIWAAASGLLFLLATVGLLVHDLERPERFLKILLRPNWDSWLARGGVLLALYGVLLAVWLVLAVDGSLRPGAATWALLVATVPVGVLTAIYTAWLFRQARGRVLWLGDMLAEHLFVQAALAGSAWLLLLAPLIGAPAGAQKLLLTVFAAFLVTQGAFLLHLWPMKDDPPEGREAEYRRARRLVTHGPFARRYWIQGMLVGVVLPAVLVSLSREPGVVAAAAALALWGLWHAEDVFVRAGQALPIS